MSASNGTMAGYTDVIRVHDTTHLAVTTIRQGNRRSRSTPHKERMSGLLNIETTHLTRTDIVNERIYNSRNKRASQKSSR